ncbi:AAA family ATPase [Macrococcoides caseolyticum]|uniref:AAA family ATPase n=1 Tax=Macrococcoides caseolyticum TaxID=69966 RepID=UPI0018E1C543|nr:AAA family ATPase [Macrococcus caseolyticus]QQB06118.1 AAA family ATPase [Macrococcus caseolyticus]
MLDITIKNIGILNNVEMKIDGITVVGAKNDSGKSTISKVLGTSLLSMNKYKDVFLDYINDQVRSIFFKIEGTFENNLNNHGSQILKMIDELPLEYKNYFNHGTFEPYNIYIDLRIGSTNVKDIDNRIDKMIRVFSFIKNHFFDYITENDNNRLSSLIKDLDDIKGIKIKDVEETLLLRFFAKSFRENLVNFHSFEPSRISIKENSNTIFEMNFDKQNRLKKHFIGNTSIKNIAYIESPQIIDHLFESILNRFDDSNKLKYTNQLQYMLTNQFKNNPLFDDNSNRNFVLNKIFEIIEGEMKAETSETIDEIYFQKGGYRIETINVATGIKSFSLIQLLLKNNWVNDEMLIIIDEPEINLHPEWQVKYAEILVLIQKYMGCKIYINTHSSYIIEAIDLYSKKYDLKSQTNYYMLDGYSSEFLDNDFQPIFKQLNGAFDILDEEKINDFLNFGTENE